MAIEAAIERIGMTKAKTVVRKKTEIVKGEKPDAKQMAEIVTRPSINSAAVMAVFNAPFGDLETPEVEKEIRNQIAAIKAGDMSNVEAMLYGQAIALQTIFVAQSRRAQVQDRLPVFQAHFNLALRAQAQCRSTLEALAELKAPRATTFVRQQNNANQQQVNNDAVVTANHSETLINAGTKAIEATRTEAIPVSSNELLEVRHE